MTKKLYDFVKQPSVLHTVITFLVSFLTTISICITGYTHYIEKNIIGDRQLNQNKNQIDQLKNEVKDIDKEINELLIKSNELQNYHHTIDLKISSLQNSISNTVDYQNVLRIEVKSLAENKMDKIYFWHIMNNLLIRVRFLERNPSS